MLACVRARWVIAISYDDRAQLLPSCSLLSLSHATVAYTCRFASRLRACWVISNWFLSLYLSLAHIHTDGAVVIVFLTLCLLQLLHLDRGRDRRKVYSFMYRLSCGERAFYFVSCNFLFIILICGNFFHRSYAHVEKISVCWK